MQGAGCAWLRCCQSACRASAILGGWRYRLPLLVGVDVHVNLIGCCVTDEGSIEGGPCPGRPGDRRAAQAGHAVPAPVRGAGDGDPHHDPSKVNSMVMHLWSLASIKGLGSLDRRCVGVGKGTEADPRLRAPSRRFASPLTRRNSRHCRPAKPPPWEG